jgi:type II secretory pathway component PulM
MSVKKLPLAILSTAFLVACNGGQNPGSVGDGSTQPTPPTPPENRIEQISMQNWNLENDQITVNGSGFSYIEEVSLSDGRSSYDLAINEKDNNHIVVAATQAMSLVAGEVYNLIISSAEASETYPIQIQLPESAASAAEVQRLRDDIEFLKSQLSAQASAVSKISSLESKVNRHETSLNGLNDYHANMQSMGNDLTYLRNHMDMAESAVANLRAKDDELQDSIIDKGSRVVRLEQADEQFANWQEIVNSKFETVQPVRFTQLISQVEAIEDKTTALSWNNEDRALYLNSANLVINKNSPHNNGLGNILFGRAALKGISNGSNYIVMGSNNLLHGNGGIVMGSDHKIFSSSTNPSQMNSIIGGAAHEVHNAANTLMLGGSSNLNRQSHYSVQIGGIDTEAVRGSHIHPQSLLMQTIIGGSETKAYGQNTVAISSNKTNLYGNDVTVVNTNDSTIHVPAKRSVIVNARNLNVLGEDSTAINSRGIGIVGREQLILDNSLHR